MKYKLKQIRVFETFTFNEFVKYGLENSDNIVNGMPWSFNFKGYAVSYENDIRYILTGNYDQRDFTSNDIILIDEDIVDIYSIDEFDSLFEKAD